MWYVQRASNSKIVGVYTRPQMQPDGTCLTDPDPLAEDDPEAMAFIGQWDRAVTAERDRRLRSIMFNEHKFDFAGSETNISGAATLALAAIIAGATAGNLRWATPDMDFMWVASDNAMVPMDAQTMLAFGQHAASWKSRHIYAARILKDKTPIPADYAADKWWPA